MADEKTNGEQPEKVTKNEAVRRALVALGRDAKRGAIRDFVKERFDLEMDLDHVSAARVAALRKLAAQEPPPPPQAAKIAKKEAVRRALATLGKNAQTAEIQRHLKQAFDIDMTAGHISTTRGEIRREGKKAKARPAAKEAVGLEVAEAVGQPTPAAVLLDDLLKIRELVDRVGADRLRVLIDVMSR
jgi:hypothetical protein